MFIETIVRSIIQAPEGRHESGAGGLFFSVERFHAAPTELEIGQGAHLTINMALLTELSAKCEWAFHRKRRRT